MCTAGPQKDGVAQRAARQHPFSPSRLCSASPHPPPLRQAGLDQGSWQREVRVGHCGHVC